MPWLSLVIRSWVLRARELTGSAVQLLAELIQLILMRGGKARGRWTAHGGRSSEERVPPGHAEKPARHRGWTAVVNAAECPNTPWGGGIVPHWHLQGGQEEPGRGGELQLARKPTGQWWLSLARFVFSNRLTWKLGLRLERMCAWKIRSEFSRTGHFKIFCNLGCETSTESKSNCKHSASSMKKPLTNVSLPVEQAFHLRMHQPKR